MIKKLLKCVICALSIFVGVSSSAHDEKKGKQTVEYSFKYPKGKDYVEKIKDYRTKYKRVTQLQKSALHWNMGIVVYINQAKKTYAHNFITYQAEFEGLGEEEDDEEEEDEGKSSGPKYKFYPPGTIIVKEQYVLGKEHYLNEQGIPNDPITLAIMIKEKPGYDKSHGDWRYIQLSKDGNEMFEGKGGVGVVKSQCGDCHKNVANRDFIYHTFYSQVQGK